MPVNNLNVRQGGLHFVERSLLQILRNLVPDCGIDDPNAANGLGHGPVRDADTSYTATGDGTTTVYTLTPPETGAPVVAVHDVTVGGATMLFGFDYIVHWGDKFGSPDQHGANLEFMNAPAAAAAIVIPYKYGKRVISQGGKQVALGSFINAGFFRGAMPLPRIQVNLETSTPEAVGIGDNFDTVNRLGAYWENMRFRITVMSQYASECKDLTDQVKNAIMLAAHDNNYLIPILQVEQIMNLDYDIETKAYTRIVMISCKAREIFGVP